LINSCFFLCQYFGHRTGRVRFFLAVAGVLLTFSSLAQGGNAPLLRADAPNIVTAKLFPLANPVGLPILTLGGGERLELRFDDLDADVKNYFYTIQLCNADWSPALLNTLDFIKGFTQVRINTYRNSSVALTRYTHYQAEFPNLNMEPTKSGNYILKVFLNGDTSKLAFERRFLVVQPLVKVGAIVQQPFQGNFFRTHQKVQFNVALGSLQAQVPQQQVKVTLLQNMRWDNALQQLQANFIRQNVLEFNPEQQALFPAGREWRWLDLRSFRLQSDRVEKADYRKTETDIFLKPDPERKELRVAFYRDNNGSYFVEPFEQVNPHWQGDYALVYFRFQPKDPNLYKGKTVWLFGELTQYGALPEAKMKWNESKKCFETSLLLKQGYYDYQYLTTENNVGGPTPGDASLTEGDNWETENVYTILVYYRAFGGRHDELVGVQRVSSLQGRTGIE
jgi:hypothetical protein